MRWKVLEVPDVTSVLTSRPLSATRANHFCARNLCVNREGRAAHVISGGAKPFRQQLGVKTLCHGDHLLQHVSQM